LWRPTGCRRLCVEMQASTRSLRSMSLRGRQSQPADVQPAGSLPAGGTMSGTSPGGQYQQHLQAAQQQAEMYAAYAQKGLAELDLGELQTRAAQAQALVTERAMTAYEASKQLVRASHVVNQYVSLGTGCLVILSAVLSFFGILAGEAPGSWFLAVLTQLYIGLFGMSIVVLEVPIVERTQVVLQFKLWVDKWLRALSRLTARGFVYFTHAILIVDAQQGYSNMVGVWVGYALAIAGIFSMIVGYVNTADVLQLKMKVRMAPDSRGTVRTAENVFSMADKDGNGKLSKGEIQMLVKQHNPVLSDLELDVFFLALDANRDGTISKEEFMVWYDTNGFSPEDAM